MIKVTGFSKVSSVAAVFFTMEDALRGSQFERIVYLVTSSE